MNVPSSVPASITPDQKKNSLVILNLRLNQAVQASVMCMLAIIIFKTAPGDDSLKNIVMQALAILMPIIAAVLQHTTVNRAVKELKKDR